MAERAFLLPDPGEGLEEAEIVTWLVAEGEAVTLNQPFVEVETAKAAVEIPSPYAGRILRHHAAAGDVVRVGTVLATFEVEGAEGDVMPEETERTSKSGPIPATPKARKLAKERGLDLASVSGSGPAGRVEAADVERAAGGAEVFADMSIPVDSTRRAIADRLSAAAAIPQVTTFRMVDCTELDSFRKELDVSPLSVFVCALSRVVLDHPMLNASWGEDRIVLHPDVSVGIAVDTERGLLVPVVASAHRLGIAALAGEVARLATGAREGHLTPGDLRGATITVTNTGSYGSESGTPLLNPGNAVTVALGAIAPRALVVDGDVVARPACTISLTFDHRVLDGAVVGRALTDLVLCLQESERLRDLPR